MTSISDRSILITGGAGFIGSHLAETLAGDNEVTVLDDLSTGTRDNVPDEADFVKGDVRVGPFIQNRMAGIDLVFHEAAVVSVDRSIDEPLATHSVTVDGTLNVLEAARNVDARVVLASSAAVYGRPARVPIHEDDPMDPISPYGLDKLAVDRYAKLYHDLYGLETIALRYFNVYGPRQSAGDYSGVIDVFFDQARNDEPITVHGDGTQTRDFVHVEDVVQANLAAATTTSVGTAYNVGTGTVTTIESLAETIRELLDSDSEIVHTDPRSGDITESQPNISAAKADLGYQPTIDLETGLSTLTP